MVEVLQELRIQEVLGGGGSSSYANGTAANGAVNGGKGGNAYGLTGGGSTWSYVGTGGAGNPYGNTSASMVGGHSVSYNYNRYRNRRVINTMCK